MKEKLRLWLIVVLLRILTRLKGEAETALEARAKTLTATSDALVASGEYKRHVVYAQLLKEFPGLPKRGIALAIEQALQ